MTGGAPGEPDVGKIGVAQAGAGVAHGFTVPVHGHAAEFGLISLVSNERQREFDRLVTAYAIRFT